MHTIMSVTISQTIPGVIFYPELLTGLVNDTSETLSDDSGSLEHHIKGDQMVTVTGKV